MTRFAIIHKLEKKNDVKNILTFIILKFMSYVYYNIL